MECMSSSHLCCLASLGRVRKERCCFFLGLRGEKSTVDGLGDIHTGITFCSYAWNGNVGVKYEFIVMFD